MRQALVLMLFLALPSFGETGGQRRFDSAYGSDLPFFAKTLIKVESYDENTRTFRVFSVTTPAEGNPPVTAEGLKRAIKSFDLKNALAHPGSLVGRKFMTDNELPTLTPDEKKSRRHG